MSPFTAALLINLLFAIFRVFYILLYPVDLSPEEAQYWDWSRELDLSYYSKPPMVAYLNALSTALLGNTEIGVRITPVLLSFILSLVVFVFARKLFGSEAALFASVIPNLFAGTAINALLMTTDAPFIFFWGVSVVLIHNALRENSTALWLLVGVSAGLAFLSKYPAVFLLPLTMLCMFLLRRDLLLSPKPYISLIPALAISSPVLFWNFRMDFVSFKHVSTLAEKGADFPNLATAAEFLGGQLALLSGVPFLFLLYGWWKAIREREPALVFLTVYSLPVFLFFLLLSLRKEVYANWAGFGYFTGSLIASLYLWKFFRRKPAAGLLILLSCALITLLLHFTPLVDRLGLRSFLPPHRDPVKIMVGWEELGKAVGDLYSGSELIFSDAYQIAAELAFYVKGNPRTFVFHRGRMTQYYLWRDRLAEFRGRDALFVSEHTPSADVLKHFDGYTLADVVRVLWRGAEIKSYRIYRLTDFVGSFDEKPRGY